MAGAVKGGRGGNRGGSRDTNVVYSTRHVDFCRSLVKHTQKQLLPVISHCLEVMMYFSAA